MTQIRKLHQNDYYKNYFCLLNQLSKTSECNYDTFSEYCHALTENHLIFVIEEDNNIVATGTLLIEKKLLRCGGKVGHIEDVIVDQNYRQRGYGSAIVKYLVEYAEKMHCYKVILDCNEKNIKFYNNNGFVQKEVHMAKYF